MSTLPELMDAYRDLADHAPGVADLHLTAPHPPPARRGKAVRAVLGAVIAVILIVASVVYLRSQVVGKHEPPANVPPTALAGQLQLRVRLAARLHLTGTDMQVPRGDPAASTTYTYAKQSTNRQATLRLLPASKLGRYRDGTPVTVGGRQGYYQAGSTSLPSLPPRPSSTRGVPAPTGSRSAQPPLLGPLSSAIAWPISKDTWAVLTESPVSFSYRDGKLLTPLAIPSQAGTIDLAESVRLRESATVAPVKVGYLPPNLELSSVQQFLESPANTFDDRFGTSYRDLMFIDRSASGSQLFTLDVGVLVAPQKPLELKDLPDARTVPSGNWSPTPYDPAKQWTQTTIAGHRAFVSAHDVIVDWGAVEVHVTNEYFPYAAQPVLDQHELIRIAASLTVPPSGTIGNGFPLSRAVPAANLH